MKCGDVKHYPLRTTGGVFSFCAKKKLSTMWDWVTKAHTEKDTEVLHFQQFSFRRRILFDVLPFVRLGATVFCYSILFAYVLLNVINSTAYGIAQHLGWNLTLGSTLKNIIGYHRPTSPPVARGNGAGCEAMEFAMPSTHAFMSVCFAIRMVFHWLSTTPSPTFFTYFLWTAFVLVWSVSISLSRVYLGFHSFQDITVGWTSGLIWAFLMELYIIPFLYYGIQKNLLFIVGLTLLWLVWLLYHPINKKSKVAFHLSEGTFDYTPPIAAVALGMQQQACVDLAGSSYGLLLLNQLSCVTDWDTLYYRYLFGIPITVLVYAGSRAVLPSLLEPLFKFLKVDCHYLPYNKFKDYIIENTKNPNNKTNEKYKMAWVRYTSKFLQYFLVTASVAFPCLYY